METRKNFAIEWCLWAFADNTECLWALLPTIYWEPWNHRIIDYPVIEFHWLIFHVCLGRWKRIVE